MVAQNADDSAHFYCPFPFAALMAFNFSNIRVARPGLLTCRARPMATASAGTSSVMTEPDAVSASSPTVTGATSMVSDPMKARLPMRGAVLHHAVIVAGDGARADIGELAHIGIAQIGQVADLDAFVEDGILDLDKVADMHVLGQFGAGAQAGKGADLRATADVAALKMAEALDFGAGFDGHAGAEDDIGADHGVAADMGVQREEHGFGGGQGDAVVQRLGAGAGLKGGLGRGQLRPGVDAQGFGFGAGDIADRQALGAGQFDDVGQIVFAGGVVVADLRDQPNRVWASAQTTPELHRVIARSASVASLYSTMRNKLIAIDDQAAIAAGIGGRKPRTTTAWTARASSMLQGFGRTKGVSPYSTTLARGIGQQGGGLGHGMGGAKLGVLHDAVAPPRQRRGRPWRRPRRRGR